MRRGARASVSATFALVFALAVLVTTAVAGATTAPTTPEVTTTTAPTTTTTSPTTSTTTSVPGAPLALVVPTASAVTVTPSTGLGYTASVTVTGAGFTAEAFVAFAECRATPSNPGDCDSSTTRFVPLDATGSFTVATTVRRFLVTADGVVDCAAAPGTCILGAALSSDYSEGTGTPLTFDPNAPIPPGPTIAATPVTGLGLQTDLTVTGSGFVPGDSAVLLVCVHGSAAVEDCSGGTGYAEVDGSGAISTTADVRRGFRGNGGDGSVVDCVVAPGCDLVAFGSSDQFLRASVPLSFDASVPLPPPPVVVVTPSTGLADRQLVTIRASGFAPGDLVTLAECATGSDWPGGADDCSSAAWGVADSDGVVQATTRVRRFVGSGPGTTDCQGAPSSCAVFAAGYGDVFATGSTPITFDPDAPVIPAATMAVVPVRDLTDGQEVGVTGSGFTPGASVALVLCRAESDDGSGRACDLQTTLRFVTADTSGGVSTTFTMRRILSTQLFGPVDCATDDRGCVLGWGVAANDPFERGNIPLTFVDPDAESLPASDREIHLAFTGAGSARLAGIGLLAVALGLALVVGATRARRGRSRFPAPRG